MIILNSLIILTDRDNKINLEKTMINSSEPEIIQVGWLDRWQVYYRLQDLDVECFCQSEEPLKAYAKHPQAAIQIWSVAKQFTANRRELIDWLELCWQIKSYK